MRTLIVFLLAVTSVFAQAAQQTRPAPEQGPPPRNLTQRADGHFSANADAASPEKFQVHVVQPGETLSQIAAQVLQNPRLWPQLWEINEHIINPHWIYPNDKILIRPVTLITEETPAPAPPPAAEPAPAPPAAPAEPQAPPAPPPAPRAAQVTLDLGPARVVPEVKTSDLYCSGFIQVADVPKDLKVIGKFSGDGGALAGEGDYIYLGQGAEDGIATGNMYQIIRPTKKIERPEGRTRDERNLGMHYLDVAQIVVVLTQPDFSLARVNRSCDVVEIGDIMLPFRTLEAPIVARPRSFGPYMKATGDVKGAVMTTLGMLSNFGTVFRGTSITPGVRSGDLGPLEKGMAFEGTILYIDVGQREGAKVGDIFIVYRQTKLDDRLYPLPEEAKALQQDRTAVGELIVLKTGERASTALVTYASDAISAGDSVERR